MNIVMTAGAFRYWQRRFRRALALSGRERVLDVGTGTADLCLLLAPDLSRGGRIVGIDLAEAMLAVGRAKVARSPYADRIELVLGNALHLPFPDASFDVVVSAFALRNFADLDRALREMRRVLTPAGRLLTLELTRPPSPWVRGPYFFYFRRILPLLGFWARRREGEPREAFPYAPYAWLPASLEGFPDAPALAERLRRAGFERPGWLYLTGGIVAIHSAEAGGRPAAS